MTRPGVGSVPSLPPGDAGGGGTVAGQEGCAGQAHAAAPGSRSSTWQHVPRAWGAAAPPAPTSKAPERGVVRTAPWFTGAKPGLQGPVLPPRWSPPCPAPPARPHPRVAASTVPTQREVGRGLAGTTGQRWGLQLLSAAASPAQPPPTPRLLLGRVPSTRPPPASSTTAPSVRLAGVRVSPRCGWVSLLGGGSVRSWCLEELSGCRRALLQTAAPAAAHPRKLVRCRRACLFLLSDVCAFSS